ncbi:MAG: hypothetical protein ACRENA_08975 [Vulcanimicrobiaceae bacterium]
MRKNAYRIVAAVGVASIALLPALAAAQDRDGSYQGQSDMQQGQVYWNNDRPYYYNRDRSRHYMNRDEERHWIQRSNPDWYREHQNEYQSQPDRFYNEWRSYQRNSSDYRQDNNNRDRDDQDRR